MNQPNPVTLDPDRFAKGNDGWPDPIPLSSRSDTPPFPVGDLPSWMRPHVCAVAAEQQVAVDLPAMLAITALAVANAKRHVVHVHGDWHEPLNIYTATALPPSAGKSPVFKRMFRAVERHEAKLIAEAEERAQHIAQRRRMIEKRMTKAETSGDVEEAQIALDELRATPPIVIPRLVVDDITVEKLVEMLKEQGGRLALLSDEGGLFDAMAGRYSDKANLDPYLQAWSGGTIRNDRVGRGSVVVTNPLLTIGVTVQPQIIEALAAKPEFAGRGLTARFMWSIPVDFVGRRNFASQPGGDAVAADAYDARLAAMLAPELPETPETIELSDEARHMFTAWRQELEKRRTPDGDLRPLATWSAKFESSVVRLAALLHIADGGEGDVPAEAMHRALSIGGYWLAHAQIVHDIWGTDPTARAARVTLDWLHAERLDQFTIRDLQRARRGAFPTAESTIPALNLLADSAWIQPLFDGPITSGRKNGSSPRFATHPKVVTSVTSVPDHPPQNLWITTPSVTSVTRRVKDISEPLSVCLSENKEPRTGDNRDDSTPPSIEEIF